MLDKIHILISIAAAVVISICGIVYEISFQVLAMHLIITIVVFYVVGSFAKGYLIKNVFPSTSVEDEDETDEKKDETEPQEDNIFQAESEQDRNDEIEYP